MTWTDPLPLPDIKAISRSAAVTVNDVLLPASADAVSRYLTEEGTPLDSVRVMVPVNLRALDQPLTSDLGNVFGEYVVTLTGPHARHHRGAQDPPRRSWPYLTLIAIGWMPRPLEDLSTRLFSGKVIATVSNVPGPRSQVSLGGIGVIGSILIGLIADATLIPDLAALEGES